MKTIRLRQRSCCRKHEQWKLNLLAGISSFVAEQLRPRRRLINLAKLPQWWCNNLRFRQMSATMER